MTDDLLFQDEHPSDGSSTAYTKTGERQKFWKVLIVDDEEEIHDVTRFALNDIYFKERSLTFLSAYSAGEASSLLSEHPDTALILLDVVMEEDDSGLSLVRYIRKELENTKVRIILRTGQPGLSPERDVIVQYDINDYKEKSELTARKLFTSVITAIRSYNDLLQIEEQTRRQERIAQEFRAAQEIQQEMMPSNFPLFPDRNDLEVYAKMKSAFEVGGDFYDAFFIGADKLCFFVGDVSGKGLGATLFMVQCKTILKREVSVCDDPATVLKRTNHFLSRMNKGCLDFYFATLFFGILDIGKGEVCFANAGHNPPLVRYPDGDVIYLQMQGGYPLSMFEDTGYPAERFSFPEGTSLLLYTDGITEAFNERKEQFGETHLLSHVAGRLGREKGEEVISTLFAEVLRFCGREAQSDDMTALSLMTF